MPNAFAPRARVAVVVALIAGIALLTLAGTRLVPAAVGWLRDLADPRSGEGPRPVVYLFAGLFTVLTVLLPFPAEASALLNGTLFGPGPGFMLTWSAAMIGVALSYEFGLRGGRRPAQRLFGSERVARLERLLVTAGWPTLLALRLSPVMAFTAINWASGILALPRSTYYWTAALGLVPGTYVVCVAPHLLHGGASTVTLLGVAMALVLSLLALSWVRIRSAR